jgi:SNF2-related domain/Helicase conserved C-terminal domain
VNDLIPKPLAAALDVIRRKESEDWHPHKYQERGLKSLLEESWFGLLADPGTGKTAVVLAFLKILLAKKLARRALVLAPLRAIYEVWPQEAAKWRDFHKLGLAILHGGNKEKILRDLQPRHQVVLMNYEGLAWLYGKASRARMLGADVLVVDESSKMKTTTSQRFRVMRKHLGDFKRRAILTGSPRPRSYEDLFGQVYLLDRGDALGDWITHFRNTYFYPTGFQMREWALLPGADKKIDKKVAPMVLRVDAQDYLKMPGKPDRTHHVTLPEKARKEYDAIEERMMSTLFDVPMASAAAARSKLCQLANGSVYLDAKPDDNGKFPAASARPVKILHTAKVEALVDLVDELQGEPILVSIGFHHDVVAIRKALGKDVPCLNSTVTRGQAAEIIARWNRGELPVLLGHPASMGHGLNLQGCSCRHVCFFDLPDDYDLYDQLFRRVWRQGNKATFVFRHHLVAVGTVDEAKMRNLARKGTGQKAFLDAMRAYAEHKWGHL